MDVVLTSVGKMRRALAVETGSKMVGVDAEWAAESQVWSAGEDQFASATRTLGFVVGFVKRVVERAVVRLSGMVSRIDMSAMASARSLCVLLMATYCAVRAGAGRVSMPAVDMPSSCSWLTAARPLRSLPTALYRRTEEPRRCAALAML